MGFFLENFAPELDLSQVTLENLNVKKNYIRATA